MGHQKRTRSHLGSAAEIDPQAAEIVEDELRRQQDTLMMIASENYASEAILDVQGSVFTNKYAEGYPGERYYAGCENADRIEELAIERAEELWGAEYVNVQPHSGSQANLVVYAGLLEPGDKIFPLNLNGGGHLSHGATTVSHVNDVYEVEKYKVDPESGRLDYDAVAEGAEEFDPDLIVSGYSAYPRIVDWERMQEIADAVDAIHMTDIAHITGLVAAGVHPSPVGVADVVTASTHKTIQAGRGGIVMTNDEEYADAIDSAVFPGVQGGPLMHNIVGKAVGFRQALDPGFEEYAEQIVTNAQAVADALQENGLSLVSDGTDVHFALVDLRDSHPDITGRLAEEALEEVGIILNKNRVPEETRPRDWSGIRVGTPGITERGFDESTSYEVGELIARVVDNVDDESALEEVAARVDEICEAHPVYEGRLD